ncbi:hypothetical protein L596_016112 [Steinernema carpocapsae]|uniref:C-type lectin domain-containing protein n=1 Tax=Steinernema carpocapsae TaxID=34508 RepID=A0A4V6A3C5_STECR|nr:hypothetical protein L596_016112 [Steinernema carpocapsae]
MKILVVLAAFAAFSSAAPDCPLACASEWTGFAQTGYCYKVFFQMKWEDAENFCLTQGGHLASIHSDAENEFVADLASTHKNFQYADQTWIGGYSKSHSNMDWAWTDGTPYDYHNWQQKQPDKVEENCIQIYSDNSGDGDLIYKTEWNNEMCRNVLRAFVCKKRAIN